MSQTPGEDSKQPATVRAEELLDNVGQRLGLFAALTAQRIQHAATYVRQEADRLDQPKTSPGEKPAIARSEESSKPPKERAEELVDQLGQRFVHFAALSGLQIQRATARAREEVEDMWAEAQNIRQEKSRKPQ